MVGFLGFAVLAIGGGALALFLGVPPVFIGAYVVGLVLLGAISGFSSGDGGGGSGGSRGSRSSGGGGSALNKAADAANGFMDALGSSSDDRSSRRDRRNRDSSTSTRSSGTSIVSLSASDISSGGSASDVDIRVSVRDGSGSGLSELKLEVPGMGSGTASISGSSHSNVYNLAGDILGSDPSPADDTYQVNAIVEDSEGYTDSKSTRFTVGGGSSDSSSSSSSSSSGSGGGNEFDFSEMFKDMTIGQSQQQQMQQQMMSWMQMYQSQMQQQQMQQMMNPGVMQFGNLLQGNFNVVNNTVIVPGENSEVEININQMQQLIQVLSQSQQNENYLLSIMAMLVQEGDGGLNQQIINQITNLVYEENRGDVSIEQEINRFINQKRVEYINNVLIQEVEQNFTLNQVQESLALQISEFFIALENTQYDIEGNEVIIAIKDAKDLRIHYSTLLQFLKVVNRVPEGLVETIVVQILNQIVVKGGQDSIDEEIVREIIMIIEKAEEGDIESSPTDIQVENIVIIDENTGEKLPEKVLDSGGLVYRASPGISSGRLKVNPRVSTSGGDLQEVIFSLSSGNGSTQKRIGVNTSSYGYNGEGVTLEDIKGQFQLNQGQQFNLGVTFIAKDGNQRNKVCRIQVKGGKGSGKGPLPDKKRNSSVPANQQSHGNSGVPANARSQGKSDLPANPQNPGGTSGSGGSGEEALVPKDENEIQKDLQEAGEDISEAEDLTQKALEDARAGRLPEAEDEAEQAEKDLEEANDDIEESEEDIYSVESVEGSHIEETEKLLSNVIEVEKEIKSDAESLADDIFRDSDSIVGSAIKEYQALFSSYDKSLVNDITSYRDPANDEVQNLNQFEKEIDSSRRNIHRLKNRLEKELRLFNHLNNFLGHVEQELEEEEKIENILENVADYSSSNNLEAEIESLMKETIKLKEQENEELGNYQDILTHLRKCHQRIDDYLTGEVRLTLKELQVLDNGEVYQKGNLISRMDISDQEEREIRETHKVFEEIVKISSDIKGLQKEKKDTTRAVKRELENELNL